MKKFLLILPLLFALCAVQSVSAQEKNIWGGIINGKASYLPKPDYPREAENLCASGQVEVEVTVVFKTQEGEVVSAKAVSGDTLLRKPAEEAALKAKFYRANDLNESKISGILVYNFPSEKKCVGTGIVNKKAKYLPKPRFNGKITEDILVEVRIQIDIFTGKVIAAKSNAENPLIRDASEKAALETKFAPVFITAPPIYVNALLVYKFKTDGKVDTNFPKNGKSGNFQTTILIIPSSMTTS